MAYIADSQIAWAALKLRLALGVNDQPIPHMATVIFKCKHLGFIKNYRRIPDLEMLEDEAAYDPERNLLLIPERTFAAINRGDPRARYTIAHELGHMWLQHPKLRHRNVSNRQIEKLTTFRRDEAQADRFAVAFLVPQHLVDDPLNATSEQIANQFQVSHTCARIRKVELEREYRRQHGMKRPLPDRVVEILKEAERRGYKPKTDLWTIYS
jgi:Zn-dependent peptidase ImmA (M78 family)